MMNVECLNASHSTTRRLSRIAPQGGVDVRVQLQLPPNPTRKGEGGLRLQGLYKRGKLFDATVGQAEQRPLISVLTVVYNGMAGLEQTIKSVLEQTYDNVEFIIIDGGSSDGTLDLIRKYEQAIDYWVSEPDGGIYAAMNKGIAVSSGDYISFLNADDYFFGPSVLKDLVAEIARDTEAKALYYGDVIYSNGKTFTSGMSAKSLIVNTIHHQGAFYSRKLFSSFRYDECHTVGADYELNLIIYLKKLLSQKLNGTVAVCGDMGVSQTTRQLLVNLEHHHVRKKHVGQLLSLLGFMIAMFNVGRRRIWGRRD